ncbi:MAG: hypothetical protein A2V93_00245 [Ignavibacteria bacterium RBG_16_34_14]|nr:MAG: hypothetical protein A2V93_00245 [Ignavibacteria bacterium RBG_16_34_14]
MNTKSNTPLVIAFVVVIVLFLLFGGVAMTGGMMNGGMHNGLNENGWMSDRSWMWFPALITLGLGIVLGWIIFKKKQ